MHLAVNDPDAVPALVAALRSGACSAEPAGDAGVRVGIPWLRGADDAAQAEIELTFFVRAWESLHPGLRISLAATPAG
ncbi:MAG TPA: hypothetical protein VEY87_08980 [Gaiellaceae bacterium]|jgi:hypothetical protein|nr:hypothetical protein [Gaiellaceae bacterium]